MGSKPRIHFPLATVVLAHAGAFTFDDAGAYWLWAAPPLPGELLFLASIALGMSGFRARGAWCRAAKGIPVGSHAMIGVLCRHRGHP